MKRHRFSFSTARRANEYDGRLTISQNLISFLATEKVDVFSFLETKTPHNLKVGTNTGWYKSNEILLLYELNSYDEWWNAVGKKTRNMVRKAEKNGVITSAVHPTEELANNICKIYNSSRKKQKRKNSNFGKTKEQVLKEITSSPKNIFIVSRLRDEVVGFSQLIFHSDTVFIKRLVSLEKYWDKGINNALIAKLFDISAQRGIKKVIFAHWSPWDFYEPSLIDFAMHSGFRLCKVNRYYAPLTWNGKIVIQLLTSKRIVYAIQWLNQALRPIIMFVGDGLRSSTI